MAFDRVLAQSTTKDRLMRALVDGRLAHAYLLHGPSGVGAEALAIELAKAVNCVNGPGEPCQVCIPCRKIGTLQHPDVRLYLPLPSPSAKSAKAGERTDGESDDETDERASRGEDREARRQELLAILAESPYVPLPFNKRDHHGIDDIRELRREASVKPYEGRRKVVILVAADRMTADASNALLKTLEEPPGDLLLVLTTDRPHRLLPTILSRCQPVRLSRLADDVLAEALTRWFHVDPGRVPFAVRQADGSLSRALASASERGETLRTTAVAFLDTIHTGTMVDVFDRIDQFLTAHKETPLIEEILDILIGYYRDLFILLETRDDEAVQNLDRRDWLMTLAGQTSAGQVETAIDAIHTIKQALARNAHPPLALTVLALRLRACRKPAA
ncbi:MAG: hypothetical protein HY710_06040 [Candidatus Latescibacteria bacterium]|nr:hypothetical protein [Candidatus Latescibacterota bacterium]